jgi:hypothetical protein
MKYLDVDGIGRVRRIGLGTWQFGSREWGYGDHRLRLRPRLVQRALALGVTSTEVAVGAVLIAAEGVVPLQSRAGVTAGRPLMGRS